MKSVRSISAAFLALLVLVSSTSFVVGMHICMGSVYEVALFTKAEGCPMDKNIPPCHKEMKASCCEDEVILHEGTDFNGTASHVDVIVLAPIDIEQPAILVSEIIPVSPVAQFSSDNYDPPLRSSDRVVSLQVFLI